MLYAPFTPPFFNSTTQRELRYGQLYNASSSLAIAHLAAGYDGLTVVLTPDSHSAQQLATEIRFFYPDFNQLTLLHFPDWETLPYDIFSPHQDLVSERLETMACLPTLTRGILILPMKTVMQRIAPRNYLEHQHTRYRVGMKLDITQLKLALQNAGYRAVSEVAEHGEYANRGAILDLFPMGSTKPLRLEFLGDEIETIRTFEPETQLTIEKINEINLLPAHEFPFNAEAIDKFRQRWRARFSGNPLHSTIYEDVSKGFCPSGIEYYLPLFFDHTASIADYFPTNTLLLNVGDLMQSAQQFWAEICERHEQRAHDLARPILDPTELYVSIEDSFQTLKNFQTIKIQEEPTQNRLLFATQKAQQFLIDHRDPHPLKALELHLQTTTARVLFAADTAGRQEALLEHLRKIQIIPTFYSTWNDFVNGDARIGITIAPLSQGMEITDPAISLISETQLFGEQTISRRRKRAKSTDPDLLIRNLAELSIGAPVVHIDHGVGRYLGLKTLTIDTRVEEFLQLEYAGGDKLYVPVSSLDLISRYSGADLEHAPLHRLGTDHWQKAKRKAAEQVRDVAAELLEIYAERASRKGHAFPAPDQHYATFAAGFPYEETEDQQKAIEAVIEDLTQPKPMDRLVCGDVGFGKTEVALRAAFLAVQGEKQVAVLVPTTLLAQQHYETFRDRFAKWPFVIELISRFRTKKEQHTVLERLTEGKVDILIGTHALLQEHIQFSKLGLLIIDEEHRFGVRQKEKLKSLRAEVDILALTATPIPRTLNMAMSGLRELSIIATPPARRLAIKTFVHEHNHILIREAILREILRGGQVYYLHNKVETIEATAEKLREWVPEARLRVAHGQMHERELEAVMTDFYHQRFNVLVCTTIIETGIDIPSANTIVIDRADKFGLAQLHQLRGRVGRSHHQAYAYLLTPPVVTKDAEKRLDAIAALEDLGIGFTLATHDLEIRGAGELLGDQQSGNMHTIGFSLYMELLEQAVKALRSGDPQGKLQPLRHGVEINLQIPALIPESYVPDVHTRLTLYKRLSSVADREQLRELNVEFIDRFGLLPDATKNLFQVNQLKLKAKQLGIKKIEVNAHGGRLDFDESPNVSPDKIIGLVQREPKTYKFEGSQRLRFTIPTATPQERITVVDSLLEKLT